MSVKVAAAFGVVVIAALGALDYQSAANARPGGQPLSVTAHFMNRLSQAEAAVGLGTPATTQASGTPAGGPAVPDSALGKALAVAAATLTGDTDAIFSSATTAASLPDAVASGDTAAMGAAVQGEFGKVASALGEDAPSPRKARGEKPGTIKVGIGTCEKSGVGKFCSVKPAKKD